MKPTRSLLLFALTCLSSLARDVIPIDRDWNFHQGAAEGAEGPGFDDSSWRKLDVPHDWSIEGDIDKDNAAGEGGAFLPTGIGWYRKSFTLPKGGEDRRVFVELDGVMANSDVWINGEHLGHRPYGYIGLRYDLTEHLKAGESNLLAVRADTSAQPASRWYAGSGIYRHARLVVTDPVHVRYGATFITTPEVADAQATVRVATRVANDSDSAREGVSVETTLIGPDGETVATATSGPMSIASGKEADVSQDLVVKTPSRWDIDSPNLYRAVIRVRSGESTLDEETTTFGIREFEFRADTGFWLNGRNFKIKGVCLHYDGGAVGMAVPLGIWESRFEALKEAGVNAVRCGHSVPDPGFLRLCDRMGILVMSEVFDVWEVAKRRQDYHKHFAKWWRTDLTDTVIRHRNHPSVIIYSAGNEIHDTHKPEHAKRILGNLIEAFHEIDPSRPVTQAIFRPNVTGDYENGFADMLDVLGQNYRENEIVAAHNDKPTRKILSTENGHTRGAWTALRDHPFYSGQFLWTGVDYLGEGYKWPAIGTAFGLLDRTGRKRAVFYQRQSWWTDEPMVHLSRRIAPEEKLTVDPGYETTDRNPEVVFSDWSPVKPGGEETIEVYSNAEEVELELNGRSLGSKPLPGNASPRVWKIPFEAGTLRGIARNGGKVVATHELKTAGEPVAVELSVDRVKLPQDWEEVCYVTAKVVDANGVQVPASKHRISFEVEGPGAIAGVDNGDNRSHERFSATERSAYRGCAIAILKANAPSGTISIKASADGLQAGSAKVEAAPAGEGR